MHPFPTEPEKPEQVNFGSVMGACWHCDMRFCVCEDQPPKTPAMVPAPDLTLAKPPKKYKPNLMNWYTLSVCVVWGLIKPRPLAIHVACLALALLLLWRVRKDREKFEYVEELRARIKADDLVRALHDVR